MDTDSAEEPDEIDIEINTDGDGLDHDGADGEDTTELGADIADLV